MLALLLALAAARADEPARCEAVFAGPVKGCPIVGDFAATGFGPGEERAGRNAVRRLVGVVDAALALRSAEAENRGGSPVPEEARRACPAAVARSARLSCFPEPDFGDAGLCFVQLDDPDCWRGLPVQVEGRRWKVAESGRDELCAEVDVELAARGDDPVHRAACRLRCLEHARVACPR